MATDQQGQHLWQIDHGAGFGKKFDIGRIVTDADILAIDSFDDGLRLGPGGGRVAVPSGRAPENS